MDGSMYVAGASPLACACACSECLPTRLTTSPLRQVDSEEVVLRRTIGLKKDEYFLNRKRYTRTDVVNLLESAGFSSSNPYYIVQQNNAHRLCDMSDEDRLRVLKEVRFAGAITARCKAWGSGTHAVATRSQARGCTTSAVRKA